jgi:hypothetical protein
MKARIIVNEISAGTVARDYMRLIKGRRNSPLAETKEQRGGAKIILETIREQDNSKYELDISITGKNLLGRMDRDFDSMGLIPYRFSNAALAAGEGISVGSHVMIPGDDREFSTVSISKRNGSVRLRDKGDSEYIVPWHLVYPYKQE